MLNRDSSFKVILIGKKQEKMEFIKDLQAQNLGTTRSCQTSFGTGFTVVQCKDQKFQIWDTLSIDGIFNNVHKPYFNKADAAIFLNLGAQKEKELESQLEKNTIVIHHHDGMTPMDCLSRLQQKMKGLDQPELESSLSSEVEEGFELRGLNASI